MSRSTENPRPVGMTHWPKLRPVSWTDRPVDERAQAVEAACRTAMQLLAGAPDRDERLRRIDPVPLSTRNHLRRLAADDD